MLGVNRQGYRLRYFVDHGPLEVHLEYTDLRQIDPETIETSTRTGFVDGYYLPQLPAAATFGRQRRTALWSAWHAPFGDLTLDLVDDTLFRPYAPEHPEDRVAYDVPQAVITYARRLSPNALAATGVGRYAMKGAFAEPIDVAQRLFFVGAALRQSPNASLLATFRRTALDGSSTFPAVSRSPAFTGSTFLLEQRITF